MSGQKPPVAVNFAVGTKRFYAVRGKGRNPFVGASHLFPTLNFTKIREKNKITTLLLSKSTIFLIFCGKKVSLKVRLLFYAGCAGC